LPTNADDGRRSSDDGESRDACGSRPAFATDDDDAARSDASRTTDVDESWWSSFGDGSPGASGWRPVFATDADDGESPCALRWSCDDVPPGAWQRGDDA
jgi:hypothetical protein